MSLLFCKECKQRSTCKAICKELEKFLRKKEIGGYSLKHKRRKEVLIDPRKIEEVGAIRAFGLKYGKKYAQKLRHSED